MDTCIRMAESLCCSPETITTLLMAIPQYKTKILGEKNPEPNGVFLKKAVKNSA